MPKKTLLNFILFLVIMSIIYGIWAIQPLSYDDWHIIKPHVLFIQPPIPTTGQQIRYCFGAAYIFPTNPFSLFKAWSLLTAIVVTSLLWMALIKESIIMRAGLTLLTALGLPYLGHIGPWNAAASGYTLSVVWMIAWYTVFRRFRRINARFILNLFLFFTLTFIAASWHEVWLVSFAGIAVYFILNAFAALRKPDQVFKIKSIVICLSVTLAYILAVVFYARGGPNRFIDARFSTPGHFVLLFNWPHIVKAFLLGTKENLVLIKDSFPVFLLIIYIKLNNKFKTKLDADFGLFLAVALGSILYMYVMTFIGGSPQWRTRCLCVLSLSVAFYALPESILANRFNLKMRSSFKRRVRFCSLILAVIWLSYNVYFTYVYTNIDVRGWLQYRQMVIDRNPIVMKGLSCRTLPKNRPRGVASWEHVWGAQDDRYRYFYGPGEGLVYPAIEAFWGQDVENRKESRPHVKKEN